MTLDLALSYVADGYPVFPCRHRPGEFIDAQTGEVETRGEKTPLTTNGHRAATRFERIVERWWSDWPDAMVGVPTGEKSGFWVLDIDVPPRHKDGRIWLAAMEAEHGPLPETRTATTASGGTHYFWNHVPGIRNKAALGDGVDTRGDGGFVCMPGSTLADGSKYVWDNDSPIADAPGWLLELVLPRVPDKAPASHSAATTPFTHTSETNHHYVDSAVDSELRMLANTGQGGRGYALNASAFNLGQLVAAGALSQGDAEAGLYQAAVSNGLLATDGETKVWGTIRRGLRAGMKQPRDIPAAQNDNTRLVDISRMIANGLARAKGRAEPDSEPEPEADAEQEQEQEPEETPAIVATAFEWIDPKTLPRREFVYGTHLARKYVSVTVAPGGVGKSNLINAEALAMASGKALLGVKPDKRMRVWVFNSEDPRDEMERRLMATCMHYGLKPSDVAGHLFLDTGREQELCVAVDDKRGVKYVEPIIEAVVAQIKRYKIDVMVVDPFVSTHGVNENDNGAIDKVAKLWAHIADECNCAIDIVHHLRKVSDREATIEDARGAVSLLAAARSVRVLNRMSPDQAKEAAVAESDRYGIFSVSYGKATLTPMSHAMDWRRLVSVPLGNGRGLAKPQDFAPAVTAWEWPTKGALIEAVPVDKAALVRTRIRNGDFVYNYQATNWAGIPIADIMGIELTAGKKKSSGHRQVERLIDGWLEAGVLEKCEENAGDPRHPDRVTTFVRAA